MKTEAKINKEDIAKNIKKNRIEKGLSQEELAKKVYSTKSTISKWENGSIVPSIEVLAIIAKELGISLYKLIDQKEPISRRIINVISKVFLYLLFWIHIDITLGVTISVVGIATGLALSLSGIGALVSVIVSQSIHGFEIYQLLFFIAIFISSPLLVLMGYYIMKLSLKASENIWNLSLNVFYKSNKRIEIKLPKISINKVALLAISIFIAITWTALSIVFTIQGVWFDAAGSLNF